MKILLHDGKKLYEDTSARGDIFARADNLHVDTFA